MKPNFIFISIFLMIILTSNIYGQNTPEELGKIVFNVFKNNDTIALDTLTPNANEILEIYKKIDSTIEFLKDKDFARKYVHHDSLFKNKCKRIMYDTAHFKIDWGNISLVKVEHSEKTIERGESSSNSKPFTIHYLEIVFKSSNIKYSLFFKGLYNTKGIWKLGENMRIRKVEE